MTAVKISEWVDPPDLTVRSEAFQDAAERIYLLRSGLGGVSFLRSQPDHLTLHPEPATPVEDLQRTIINDWLPAILPFQNMQVLHASAALLPSGHVIAFTAPSGTGKSTLAYGLGQRPEWRHLADDSLILECDSAGVKVAPVRTEIRLRPASAQYFQAVGQLDSPANAAVSSPLKAIYVLRHLPETDSDPVTIVPVPPAQAYLLLLREAYALTLAFADFNQRIMRDYLCVSRNIPVFELSFRLGFELFDTVLDAVESHAYRVTAGIK